MCEDFKRALVDHLKNGNIYPGDDKCPWDIEELPVYGRCLIANRDIEANEEIFRDHPLIVGPRVNNYLKVIYIKFIFFFQNTFKKHLFLNIKRS